MDLKFKYFLLNEDATYLAGRIGDILNAIEDVTQNIQGMGTRQLARNCDRIVNQIKRILHTNWGSDNLEPLESLQRVGVAIKKAIEEKDDLQEILANSTKEIQDTLAKMGVPINKLGAGEEEEENEPTDQTSPPKHKRQEIEQQPQNQDQGQQNTDGMPGGMGTDDAMGGMGAAPPGAAPAPM